MNPRKRREIFQRLRAQNPHPATELEYTTPFELLVAVILSAQATDKGVNLATRKLFPVANTPQAIVDLGLERLTDFIKTIGLFRNKAKNVLATCEILVANHGGEVPRDRESLEALPGVGRKTANVVLNTAFGEPTMAVDTHIFRVSNRTGIAPGRNVDEVERRLLKFVDLEFLKDAHHWLILHGRYVCQARKPLCPRCIIADLCEYRPKTKPEQTPTTTASLHPAPAAASPDPAKRTAAGGVGARQTVAKQAGTKRAPGSPASPRARSVHRKP